MKKRKKKRKGAAEVLNRSKHGKKKATILK
jgi:hypothetical protein